eukprot:m.57258 g.57258  ORF g.57258 m.57258 type:complete len:269 (+) comp13063_c0_seq1:59-865(+)
MQRLVVFGVLALLLCGSHFTSAQCTSHAECGEDEYCDAYGDCHTCASCSVHHDPIDGSCPVCTDDLVGVVCSTHDDCFQGLQYCDVDGGCFACQGCVILSDGIDGDCPVWCFPASSGSQQTSSTAQNDVGSNPTEAPQESKNKSKKAEVAVAVVGSLLLVAALIGAALYLRYTKRKEEHKFVQMTQALAAQEVARGSIAAMSLRHEQRRQSQMALLQTQNSNSKFGEYIDVTHNQQTQLARQSSGFDDQLYDEEFLELAREMGDDTAV